MPTTYTHHAYGQDVLKRLPEKLQKEITPYIDYYNIGVHGPDILFYYHCYRKNAVNRHGVKLHNQPAAVFFARAIKLFQKEKNKKAAAAYLCGFMTHFILDSSCHPYIRKQIKKTGVSHTEIESDWDTLVLLRNGKSVSHFRRAKYVKGKPGIARMIAPYLGQSPLKIRTSIAFMKLLIDHVFQSGFGIKRGTAAFINYAFLPKMDLHQYFIKEEIHPADRVTCAHLWVIYEESQELCAAMIEGLYRALYEGDVSFCKKECLAKLFS